MKIKIFPKSAESTLNRVTNIVTSYKEKPDDESKKRIKIYSSDKIRNIVQHALKAAIEIDARLEKSGKEIIIPETYNGLDETDMWSLKKNTENRFSERVRNIIQPVSSMAQMFELAQRTDTEPNVEEGAWKALLITDLSTLTMSMSRIRALSAFANQLIEELE